jgi:hypothetical protein
MIMRKFAFVKSDHCSYRIVFSISRTLIMAKRSVANFDKKQTCFQS